MTHRPACLALLLIWITNAGPVASAQTDGARYIHQWNRTITETMIEDGFPPPTASRNFAYAHIAAYEALRHGDARFQSLDGQLTGLRNVPLPEKGLEYNWLVAGIAAYKTATDKLLFRIYITDSLYQLQMAELARTVTPEVLDRSRAFGEKVGAHIWAWAKEDGYIALLSRDKYDWPRGTGVWEPTPPDFLEPALPFWNTIRPMTLRSPNQFQPDGPVPYSDEKGSDFYKQAMEIYTITTNLTPEQTLIARYWDDSPVKSNHYGHLMYMSRQISPPGHWMSIAQGVATSRNAGMMESLEAYVLTSVALLDGVISCWDEKYRSNVVRPITYIHRHIDSTWAPLIQTPPFPEHTSGHSTFSAAAATVLTRIYGDIAFTDSTEVEFGLPARTFPNFMAAAQEAGISRMYGGIHYRRGNEAGNRNGQRVGQHVYENLKLRK